jgi:outer membrane protein assembly factor BamE (lipoprotein component of BamABCDE complex)
MGINMRKFRLLKGSVVFGLALFSISACESVGEHAKQVRDAKAEGDRVTVGTVQREIKVGMSSAEVVGVLGAPNMVTTDSQRRENWVYDKISTERVYSASSGGVSSLFLGGAIVGPGLVGGGGGVGYSSGAGASSTSQKTLTIIIKYDKGGKVRDFAYRYSSF